jgi:UPF0716 protein FxsA
MFLLILFVVLIGVPLLEIYVVIQVGQAIGVLPTLALLVLDAMIGSALMRSQGRAVWSNARKTLASGRAPTREILDGALVIAGGALLIAPGFITDALGALLLLPPSRARARGLVVRYFTRRLPGNRSWGPPRHGGGEDRAARKFDVEGSAIEVDPPGLER